MIKSKTDSYARRKEKVANTIIYLSDKNKMF